MDAVKYFEEKNRMTKSCKTCKPCKLSCHNNGEGLGCGYFEINFPNKAIEIVEQWAAAHPQKTQADLFFERYPDAVKDKNGFPNTCPKCVGLISEEICISEKECIKCREKYWSAPVKEN